VTSEGRQLRRPSWAAQAFVVLSKDVLIEARTREIVTTSTFFAALVVIIASFALHGGPVGRTLVAAGVIWLAVAFSTVLALGRAWQREREEAALDGLLVSPLSRSAIFAGKALGLVLFLAAVELVVIPLTALLFAVDLPPVALGLLAIAAAATPGIAATGTLFGAMTVRTRARDLILAVVLCPLLAPTLLTAVGATRELLAGVPLSELVDYFKLMLVFDLVFIAGGLGLFGTLVEN
jgi:heme exporter protein B